jgi:RNase P subunit RPR2
MALCTQCHTPLPKATIEPVDGVYQIHSWSCTACGHVSKMAMSCIDPVSQRSFFNVMMEPSTRATHRAAA